MMTPRERVLTILHGGTPDQVPWFGDLDYWATALIARGERAPDFKLSDDYMDWHRELGVGFYLQGHFPFREIINNCEVKCWNEGSRRYRQLVTPKGELQECWLWSDVSFSEAPIERLVKSGKDLAAYRYFYENLDFEPDFSLTEKRSRQVAEVGVVLCYLPRSPLMQMVAADAGIENIVGMYCDAPVEFAETIHTMKETLDKAVDIATRSPAEILMIPENLSSEVVGTDFFDRFMRDIQADWVSKIHKSGKYSCIHIDGTLKGLLRQEAALGFTFLEALTPAPTGDLPVEEWEKYIGSSGPIAWGGIPGAYFTDKTGDQEFDRHIREVLEVMRRKNRFVLGVADQVPPDALSWRVARVYDLVNRFGYYL